MSDRQPPEMAQVAGETGAKKIHRTWDRVLVSAFLGGAYIAFGALVAITVSSGLDPATWGTLPTLFMGAAFTLGLVLVLIGPLETATVQISPVTDLALSCPRRRRSRCPSGRPRRSRCRR